jgi:hypothetical protein
VPDARRGRLDRTEHLDVVEVAVEAGVDELIELLVLDCPVQ